MLLSVGDLTRVGAYDVAEKWLSRALELKFELTRANKSAIGLLRYAQSNCARAESFLNASLYSPASLILLAGCYSEDGRTDEAKAILKTAGTRFGIN